MNDQILTDRLIGRWSHAITLAEAQCMCEELACWNELVQDELCLFSVHLVGRRMVLWINQARKVKMDTNHL